MNATSKAAEPRTSDPMLAGVINSGRRGKGWMTSGDCHNPEKIKQIGRDGAALMARLVAEYNAGRGA